MPFKDLNERRAYGRAWMRRNAQKAREAMRRWRAAHRQQHRAARNEWDRQNRAKADARKARYAERHPETRVAARERRRARQLDAAGTFTAAEFRALVAQHAGRCAYCGEETRLGPDHRTPLARGGTNEIANILPACGGCNRRKHTLTEREFRVRLLNENLPSTEFEVVDWWAAGPIQSVT